VFRLNLEGSGFFLKRQSDYFTRTLHRPCGEPTVAREFRNIERYQRLGIPSLQAVFFGERKVDREHRAVLLTRALDGWMPLTRLLANWQKKTEKDRRLIISACAALVGKLHLAGLKHGCLYPKHLFVHEHQGHWQACLIDLEKTRRLWLRWRDQVRDLETFLRTVRVWDGKEQREFLEGYLRASGVSGSLDLWQQRLGARRKYKEEGH
jgi:tRNA A-37 threonylcarbamoyl transferase component Bud32